MEILLALQYGLLIQINLTGGNCNKLTPAQYPTERMSMKIEMPLPTIKDQAGTVQQRLPASKYLTVLDLDQLNNFISYYLSSPNV